MTSSTARQPRNPVGVALSLSGLAAFIGGVVFKTLALRPSHGVPDAALLQRLAGRDAIGNALLVVAALLMFAGLLLRVTRIVAALLGGARRSGNSIGKTDQQ